MVDLILFDEFCSEVLDSVVLVVDEFYEGVLQKVLYMFALNLF